MRKISHLLVREDNRRRWPGSTRGCSIEESAVRHRAASNRRTSPIPREDRLPTQFDGNGMGCWISSCRFFNEDGPSKPPLGRRRRDFTWEKAVKNLRDEDGGGKWEIQGEFFGNFSQWEHCQQTTQSHSKYLVRIDAELLWEFFSCRRHHSLQASRRLVLNCIL